MFSNRGVHQVHVVRTGVRELPRRFWILDVTGSTSSGQFSLALAMWTGHNDLLNLYRRNNSSQYCFQLLWIIHVIHVHNNTRFYNLKKLLSSHYKNNISAKFLLFSNVLSFALIYIVYIVFAAHSESTVYSSSSVSFTWRGAFYFSVVTKSYCEFISLHILKHISG